MALSKRLLFIIGSFFVLFLFSCAETSSDPDPEEPATPSSVNMISPSADNTYWSDQAVTCQIGATNVDDNDIEWLVGDQVVACTDGTLDTQLAEGEYTVTVRASAGGDIVQDTADITVKEGFSVTLDQPVDASKFFVGDQLTCDATVTPEKYADALEITVGGDSCTGGATELRQSGETTVTATVAVDGRSETDAATITVQPAIAGKIYPMTDQGVSTSAGGFTVTLRADGNSATTQTTADGNFTFNDVSDDVYDATSITMEVASNDDFYGARAEFATYTPWTPDDDGIPITAGEQLREITSADSLGFVLAPRRWQIRCGPLSGESTTIKLPEAFKRHNPDDSGSSFYKLRKTFQVYRYMSTRPDYRPLPTAFNEAEGSESITAADSIAFWQETDEVFEPRLCRGDLFSPATLEEVPDTPDGVHVWAIGASDGSFAGTYVSFGKLAIIGGFMSLAIDEFGTHIQRHELGHNLGFGHTSEWVGTMSVGSFPGDTDISSYSVNDVSHIQLYMDTFDLQLEESISFGVLEWRRVFNLPSLPDN